MEVYRILDEMEAELEECARIPLTNKIVIQDEAIYKYIDRLRATLPEDIRQAQWVKKERLRLLDDAELEAQKIIENAKDKVRELASESEIQRMAEQNSQEILKNAKTQALEITQGAFSFADEIMGQIQAHLEKHSQVLKEGRQQIKQVLQTKQSAEKVTKENVG
ncbi:MAG: ATPase [Peptococcales bacterium]|jgi:cell division septum initiation protein DivIVA